MLRETMTSTMPVAMMATVDVWTERFQRLRGVRNTPPDMNWNPSQTIARATIMPSMRASISVACMNRTNQADPTMPSDR